MNRYKEWVTNVTLGEALGFSIPAIAGALSVTLAFSQLEQALLLVIAGLCEGAVLGFFQARVLSRHLSSLRRKTWILATVLGAGAAWTIGMIPSTFYDAVSTLPLPLLIALGGVAAMVLLLSIGVAQYIVLKDYVRRAYKWIVINVVAWLVGLTVVFSFMFMAPNGFAWTIAFGILGGLGMALSMAAITGIYAARLRNKGSL